MTASAAPADEPPSPALYRLPLRDRDPQSPPPTIHAERAWTEPLLRQNAIWFCRLRWIVVAVLTAAGIASFFPERLARLGLVITPAYPFAAAAILALLNSVFTGLAHRTGDRTRAIGVEYLLWAQIISDLLVLTAVIHWLGRGLPAAPFMYLFHIILACIAFPPRASLLVAGLAAGFYLASLLLSSLLLLPPTSLLVETSTSYRPPAATDSFSVASLLLIWIVIWYLVSCLARTLRRRERELALTNLRLKASSEERANHMLQTTHQLKAPFAAIHAQTQLLLGEYCGVLPSAAREVVAKISTRCLALSRQIQEMLQLANLRSQGQTAPPRRELQLVHILDTALARIEPAARQRGIRLDKDLQPVTVHGAEDHWTMLVDNLLVNAVNYSHDRSVVTVSCRSDAPAAWLAVRDRGIGIPPEKLPRIFDDYYRTDEAVQHNRTSTGLGLAIVRQAARQTGVEIQVESAPGWGTRVTVTIPHPAHPTLPNQPPT